MCMRWGRKWRVWGRVTGLEFQSHPCTMSCDILAKALCLLESRLLICVTGMITPFIAYLLVKRMIHQKISA